MGIFVSSSTTTGFVRLRVAIATSKNKNMQARPETRALIRCVSVDFLSTQTEYPQAPRERKRRNNRTPPKATAERQSPWPSLKHKQCGSWRD